MPWDGNKTTGTPVSVIVSSQILPFKNISFDILNSSTFRSEIGYHLRFSSTGTEKREEGSF